LARDKSARLKDKEHWLVLEDLFDKKVCFQTIACGSSSVSGFKIRVKAQNSVVLDDYELTRSLLEPFRFVLREIGKLNRQTGLLIRRHFNLPKAKTLDDKAHSLGVFCSAS
jgi:hypothetical protein